jgi:hypothetical protein
MRARECQAMVVNASRWVASDVTGDTDATKGTGRDAQAVDMRLDETRPVIHASSAVGVRLENSAARAILRPFFIDLFDQSV